mgnify:CR=1 FL=1
MSKVPKDDKIRELKHSVEFTLKEAGKAGEGWIEDVCMMLKDTAEILEELEDRISQLESRDLD